MRPDLLDPFVPVFFAERHGPRPTQDGSVGPNSGPERCSGFVLVFGLKTSTAPVPGGTIGGETRRVYIERPARVNRQPRLDPIQVGQRDAQYTRSAFTPQGRRFEPPTAPQGIGGKPTLRPDTARHGPHNDYGGECIPSRGRAPVPR
jgi:hypothetical protein